MGLRSQTVSLIAEPAERGVVVQVSGRIVLAEAVNWSLWTSSSVMGKWIRREAELTALMDSRHHKTKFV